MPLQNQSHLTNMTTVIYSGNIIRDYRIKAGLSQEKLADLANINLRTLQRIESEKSAPRASTARLICDALNISLSDIANYEYSNHSLEALQTRRFKKAVLYMHSSVLTLLFIPFGNLLSPFLIYNNYKDEFPELRPHFVRTINDQLLWSLVCYGTIMAMMFLIIFEAFIFMIPLLILLVLVLVFGNLAYALFIANKLSKQEESHHLPNLIKFIK